MPNIVFYARVSAKDQKLDLQLDAARRLGAATADIFVEKGSGVRHDRPQLANALAALGAGDTLACFKLDLIGRSLAHLTKLLAELERAASTSARSRMGSAPRAAPASSCSTCLARWRSSSAT